MANDKITPFTINVAQEVLSDLQQRLKNTRLVLSDGRHIRTWFRAFRAERGTTQSIADALPA